jgi:hypothetical protein
VGFNALGGRLEPGLAEDVDAPARTTSRGQKESSMSNDGEGEVFNMAGLL